MLVNNNIHKSGLPPWFYYDRKFSMNIEHNLFGIATFWRGKLRHKIGAKNLK
jgi:hypothetical protein